MSDLRILRERSLRVETRRLLKAMLVLGATAVLTSIYYRVDALMVLRIGGPAEAAQYGAAYRLFDQARLLPMAILVPIGPVLAYALSDGKRLPKALDRALLRVVAGAGLGLALGCAAIARPFVSVVMGPAYEEAGRLFVLLGISLAFSVASYVAVSKVVNAGREHLFFATALFGVIVNVALNLFLIPRYGPAGAAYATLFTEFATAALNLSFVADLSNGGARRTLFALAAGGIAIAVVDASLDQGSVVARTVWAGACVVLGALLALWSVQQLRALDVAVLSSEPADPSDAVTVGTRA